MSRTSSNEDMIMRHRQEKKELLALTQKMKHGIPKGDKKKKKDVMAEIAVMLSDLELKHEKELKELEMQYSSAINESSEFPKDSFTAMQEDKGSESDLDEKLPHCHNCQKLTKAQKRRNKKAEQQKARELAISQQELENINGARFLEAQEIANKLSLRNLSLHEVPPDGNCLFKAIEHQLATHNVHVSAEALREATSNYLMSHKEEFQPFLINPKTDDMFTDDEYMDYCEKMKDPSVWGGQVEIQALTHICGKPIEIIQANGPNITSGELGCGGDKKLIISYHRYQFGLGAHYNSTQPN